MARPAAKKKRKQAVKPGYRKDGTKKRPNVKVLTVESLSTALRKLRGNFQACADHFKCTRSAVSQYIDTHADELKPVVRESREGRLDFTESKLDERIAAGSDRAIEFLLSTLGKKRGYVRHVEVSGADPTTGALPIMISLPVNGRELPIPSQPITNASQQASEEKPEDKSGETERDSGSNEPV